RTHLAAVSLAGLSLAALSLAALALTAAPARAQAPLKIGVLSDFSSVYSDIGGQGNLEATKLAVEEFGGTMFGKPIEVISADPQNKADIAASIARKWYENEGVDMIIDMPTSATAAMMLAGFQQYGLNPGPLLFAERPDLVWGLIASLFIANTMLLVLNLPLVGLWVRLLKIPTPWLYAGILVFATMGTIAAKPSVVELSMLAGFGVLGFLMRRFDFPIAPVVVGLILGPIAESQLRRALAISLGDPMTLLQSPISATLLVVALIALIAPFILKGLGRFKANED
ncbi:MAG: tripartite tricarboxylate transporter permease, partial [Bradyrhizobium sp.]|nr:tripartite tricarboxylate transporter permease [Bradyrhizobium sp.]